MRLAVITLVLASSFARAEQSEPQFSLLGLWRTVRAVTRDGRDITPRDGAIELQFLPDHTIVETVLAPRKTGDQPVRIRYWYTFEPPDGLNYTYRRGGEILTQHQRFHVTGDTASFENVESGIVTTMRRIEKSEFPPPKDLPELPK